MAPIKDYINKLSAQSSTLEAVLEFAGSVPFARMSLVQLLVIHYLLTHVDIDFETSLLKLIDLIHIEIMERLTFVPSDNYASFLFNQEKPYLELKHLHYAKLILLDDFEQRLKLMADEKLSASSRLMYKKLTDLFCYVSRYCLDPRQEVMDDHFTVDDLANVMSPDEHKFIYFKELEDKIKKELESVKFLKDLSTMNVWESVTAILKQLQREKLPFLCPVTERE